MMATPKMYVLIKRSECLDLYADERLLCVADEHPALRRDTTDFSSIGSELVRYWVHKRYQHVSSEVEQELRATLDAKCVKLQELENMVSDAIEAKPESEGDDE
jgi:hypothetical protein